MRPTLLGFQYPSEFTPGPYPVKHTYDGQPLEWYRVKLRGKPGVHFTRELWFKADREKWPGVGDYDLHESTNFVWWRKNCTIVMKRSILGDVTASGNYCVVGNIL